MREREIERDRFKEGCCCIHLIISYPDSMATSLLLRPNCVNVFSLFY